MQGPAQVGDRRGEVVTWQPILKYSEMFDYRPEGSRLRASLRRYPQPQGMLMPQ